MTYDMNETPPTVEEGEVLLANLEAYMELQMVAAAREAEYQAELANARNSFEAYWAGSASASVMRDYRAGRVTTVKARNDLSKLRRVSR